MEKKKRGRKPKNQAVEPKEKQESKRGRGRRSRANVLIAGKRQNEFNPINDHETLVLELPVTTKVIESVSHKDHIKAEKSLLQYNPVLSEPKPYEEAGGSLSNVESQPINKPSVNEIDKLKELLEKRNISDLDQLESAELQELAKRTAITSLDELEKIRNKETIPPKSSFQNETTPKQFDTPKNFNLEYNPNITDSKDPIPEYQGYNESINGNDNNFTDPRSKKIEPIVVQDIKYYKTKLEEEYTNSFVVKKDVYPLLPGLFALKAGEWLKKTTVHCWWCCFPFEDSPVAIPVRYLKKTDQFSVKGCFCSFNCAKKYIIETKNNQVVRDRSLVLLSMMYSKLTGKKNRITPALDREILNIFGGPFTIEQFRDKFQCISRCNINTVPMIPVISQLVQETKVSNDGTSENKTNVEDSAKSKLRLKRSKPLPNAKFTLDSLIFSQN